jgi:hypothetical protein
MLRKTILNVRLIVYALGIYAILAIPIIWFLRDGLGPGMSPSYGMRAVCNFFEISWYSYLCPILILLIVLLIACNHALFIITVEDPKPGTVIGYSTKRVITIMAFIFVLLFMLGVLVYKLLNQFFV